MAENMRENYSFLALELKLTERRASLVFSIASRTYASPMEAYRGHEDLTA